MGDFLLTEVPVWNDIDTPEPDPDASVPIGAISAEQLPTLTRVFADAQGIVRYGEEIGGVRVWRDRPLRVQLQRSGAAGVIRLVTMEIEDTLQILKGMTAVVSFRPVSFDWFGTSRFRSVNRISIADRNEKIGQALQEVKPVLRFQDASIEAKIWEYLSNTPQDLFGNEDCYYARFMGYEQSDTSAVKDSDDEDDATTLPGLYADSNANRRPAKPPSLLFGICEDFAGCQKALRNSELLAESLEIAKYGTEEGGPEVLNHKGEREATTATVRELAEPLWKAAITRALAGPDESERAKFAKHERLTSEHGEVALNALWIFKDMLWNLHKRRINSHEPRLSRSSLEEIDPILDNKGRLRTRRRGGIRDEE